MATSQRRISENGIVVGVGRATSTPTPDLLLQFDPVRAGQKLLFGLSFGNIAILLLSEPTLTQLLQKMTSNFFGSALFDQFLSILSFDRFIGRA